ncbi:hybrid sensor histidine kinase/response regulator [bacterium]|nr:hybrid sensor histidine kinase/response regulator [bacterium]
MRSRILVVDDNPKNIQLLATMLTQSEYDVEYALGGDEAIEWARQEEFDAILLDIMMPGMNGFDVCVSIKNMLGEKSCPILFLTARDDIDTIRKAFSVGGVDYITKPFARDELLSRLNTHIELHKNRQKLADVNSYLAKEVNQKTQDLQDAYKKLQVANEDLEQLDTAKTDFLQMISHELRTPLNGVVGSANLLSRLDTPKEWEEIIDILQISVSRLERYSNYALNISRLKVIDNAKIIKEEIRVVDFVKQCVNSYSNDYSPNDFKWDIQSVVSDHTMLGDKVLIKGAIFALMDVSKSQSTDNNASIELFFDEEYFHCVFTDNGALYADGNIQENSISSVAYEINTNRNKSMELFFVKSVLAVYKGGISLHNNGKGTQTKISFPYLN